MTHYGRKFVFGIQPMKPIVGAPEGRQRVRMRNTRVAWLHVRTADGFQHFLLEDLGDVWRAEAAHMQGKTIQLKH